MTNDKEMLYNADFDKWHTKAEVIKNIIDISKEEGLNFTEEEAESHLDYSIKHGILYTKEGYKKHFKPYEN